MRITSLRITSLLSSLLLCAGIAAGAASPAVAQNFDTLPKPVPMPAFKLPGLNGTSGSDADLRNKVTVIRFWASW